ncbi:Uncharacterised protein [Shigella sonnei]|nr:Uncharacterised protein [Shigella sonnei]
MDEERVFSLSYEQLTRIAEKNIRECGLDSQSARCLNELRASAGRRMTGNDSEPPTVATAAESADCAGCP